ncbi:MAG: putative DNA binding domain-containing protein [Chloroflexia bacterium]|nr:putative DNA binding domain-containing protein [Chloroflexia bacterium]
MNEKCPKRWLAVDLHVHTPASADYEQPELALLDILRQALQRGLDIVGLVDHNTVQGYEQLRLEWNRLSVMQETGPLPPEEEPTWQELQNLFSELLILPGFELTTAEDIHLLALFPPESLAERLYGLLLNLGIPMERLREGSPEIRAQADLNRACTLVTQAGGLIIAAHIESDHGLKPAEQGLPTGLLALETRIDPDQVVAGPLPRVWFSNAHSLHGGTSERYPWGIGENYTEMLMEQCSFAALRELLRLGDQELLRFPEQIRLRAELKELSLDPQRLILYGPEQAMEHVYREVAALANAGGGVLFIGLQGEKVVGVSDPESWSSLLLSQTREKLQPSPQLNLELLRYDDKEVIRVQVHTDMTPPYLTSEGVLYVRRAGETRPATRQELLELISPRPHAAGTPSIALDLPQAGVEIVGAHLRDGQWFYDVRDLRVTSGVTRQRAKGLWGYAIERHEALRQGRVDLGRLQWRGELGIWRSYYSGDRRVYDLMHRDSQGQIDHVFYGVSEWGLVHEWRELVETLAPLQQEQPSPPPQKASSTEQETASSVQEESAPTETAAESDSTAEAEIAAPETPSEEPPTVAPLPETPSTAPASTPQLAEPVRVDPGDWGGRLPRWREQAAVEHIYREGTRVFFDLAMRQQDQQVRYFRRIHRNQLAGADGWLELIQVPRPSTGVEVVRCTASGEENLYQFRDMRSGRIDPRVRRAADFDEDSPYAYAVRMYHQDQPLQDRHVRWWGNIGYMRPTPQRVDLVYRDEDGKDCIFYAAERHLLSGEWRELLHVWEEQL